MRKRDAPRLRAASGVKNREGRRPSRRIPSREGSGERPVTQVKLNDEERDGSRSRARWDERRHPSKVLSRWPEPTFRIEHALSLRRLRSGFSYAQEATVIRE